jgi:hypothetical protein
MRFPTFFNTFSTSYPQGIMHKLVVVRNPTEDSIRARVLSTHESMSDLLKCGLCRRLMAAGFRIDLAQDPKPRCNASTRLKIGATQTPERAWRSSQQSHRLVHRRISSVVRTALLAKAICR